MQKTHPRKLRPTALTRATECQFFRMYNNLYDGYFADVQYADGRYELWFVVDLRSECLDDDWYIQKIR